MILDKKILIGLSPRNVSYYEQKGYEIPRKKDKRGRTNYTKGTKIEVDIKDLMPTSKVKVKVKCESCGIERKVYYDTLAYRKNSQFIITGETLCVKCSNKKLFSGENSPFYKHGNNRFCEYRYNSQKRGIEFHLSIEEFENIVKQECYYCGGYSTDTNENSRGNGIDRMDSNKPYEISNCVPCCATCNFIKNNMPYSNFIKYIRRLYERTKNYEI
jgi:hypothetical protein